MIEIIRIGDFVISLPPYIVIPYLIFACVILAIGGFIFYKVIKNLFF